MKRLIVLLIIAVAGATVLISARGAAPSAPVIGPGTEPVLSFWQNRMGLIAVIIVPVVLFFLFFGGEILRFVTRWLLNIFAPIIREEKRINRTLSHQIEANEKKLNATEQTLKEFTSAVAEYARHLSSHTSAIQGLAEASREMNLGGEVQNRFVEDIIKNTEERLVTKEALLATMNVNLTPEGPTPEDEKPLPKKPRPSYRDLHPAPPPPAPTAEKPVPEPASLAEAMVLPYYRALNRLDKEKENPEAEKPAVKSEEVNAEAKKAVESIMFPLYRTLYSSDKPGETGTGRKPAPSLPPGCARRHHPLRP